MGGREARPAGGGPWPLALFGDRLKHRPRIGDVVPLRVSIHVPDVDASVVSALGRRRLDAADGRIASGMTFTQRSNAPGPHRDRSGT